MARRTVGQERFSLTAGKKKSELDALSKLINWQEVDALMVPISDPAKGEQGWPSLWLLKALQLARWYDLSDVKLAEALVMIVPRSVAFAVSSAMKRHRNEQPSCAFAEASLGLILARGCSR